MNQNIIGELFQHRKKQEALVPPESGSRSCRKQRTAPNADPDVNYKIEYDPNSQKMVVQFPEAYAQYEYQQESKKFYKVHSPPRENLNNSQHSSMFRHVVPQ